jgi:hypothetical protein
MAVFMPRKPMSCPKRFVFLFQVRELGTVVEANEVTVLSQCERPKPEESIAIKSGFEVAIDLRISRGFRSAMISARPYQEKDKSLHGSQVIGHEVADLCHTCLQLRAEPRNELFRFDS